MVLGGDGGEHISSRWSLLKWLESNIKSRFPGVNVKVNYREHCWCGSDQWWEAP